ncbi:hypothetical protein PG999_013091 [Apiospora kogelbergensis]|uniref:Ankyrin repeat-containing protein n=1 Tax=Apiospora kogelbergensis TaxID=1337665 RepID=A0AAW0QGL5_9PEZI
MGRKYTELGISGYIDRGGRYCLEFQNGTTVLYNAIKEDCLQLTEILLGLGADPNRILQPEQEGWPWPRWDLSWWYPNHVAMLRLLIDKGANSFRIEGENLGLDYPFGLCLGYGDIK